MKKKSIVSKMPLTGSNDIDNTLLFCKYELEEKIQEEIMWELYF